MAQYCNSTLPVSCSNSVKLQIKLKAFHFEMTKPFAVMCLEKYFVLRDSDTHPKFNKSIFWSCIWLWLFHFLCWSLSFHKHQDGHTWWESSCAMTEATSCFSKEEDCFPTRRLVSLKLMSPQFSMAPARKSGIATRSKIKKGETYYVLTRWIKRKNYSEEQ